MKVNLRGGGQLDLKPLAQIADSVEPQNYRDITVTGLTTEELESEAVQKSIRTYGLSEEEMGKIPHIDFNCLGNVDEAVVDADLCYYVDFNPINSDTFPTVEGSTPLTTSSILNTEYILYGAKRRPYRNIVLKLDKVEGDDNQKAIRYLSASRLSPVFSIEFNIEGNLFKDPYILIGSDA